MTKTLTLTFEKSQNDIPIIVVSKKNNPLFSVEPSIRIERVITGEEAIFVWNLITGENLEEETNDNENSNN